MRAELEKKVSQAIRFLQSIKLNDGEVVEVCYSGGKDSDVILQLVKESGIPYRAIYKNTTIDPPGTIKHAMEMGAEVIRPKISFFHLMRKKGFPSRYVRHCCRKLKEYKILDKQIVGVRKSESYKRAKRYKEPEQCREYTAKEKARQYYPILYWTDEDVAEFIADRNIKCAPVYYDRGGQFRVERRLGCMCCPLASRKKRIEEFKAHPKMVKLYCKAEQVHLDEHPKLKSNKIYKDAYEKFVMTLFYDNMNDFREATKTMFGEVDCKEFLENYFKVKL